MAANTTMDGDFFSIDLTQDLSKVDDHDADDESSTQKSFDSGDGYLHQLDHNGFAREFEAEGLTTPEGLSPTSPILDVMSVERYNSSVFDSEEDDAKTTDIIELMRNRGKPKLVSLGSSNSTSSASDLDSDRQSRKRSAVDVLLFDIYERYHTRGIGKSIDSDNVTECSTTSSSFYFASGLENDESREKLDKGYLETKGWYFVLVFRPVLPGFIQCTY